MRLKDMLPHGQFLNEVKSGSVSVSNGRPADELAHEWDDIERAVTWVSESGPLSLSVDGALALVKKWRQAMSGDTTDNMPASERRRGLDWSTPDVRNRGTPPAARSN